jgi:hypothetical protein
MSIRKSLLSAPTGEPRKDGLAALSEADLGIGPQASGATFNAEHCDERRQKLRGLESEVFSL